MVASPEQSAVTEQKAPKATTKAERRALQEAQRAAKAAQSQSTSAAKASGKAAGTDASRDVAVANTNTKDKGKGKEVPQQNSARHSQNQQTTAAPVHIAAHLFTHLDPSVRPSKSSKSGSAEVHPAVASLALQWSSLDIVGANARCISMLTAFKQVIQSYVTPSGQILSRHLVQHTLSPQIEHLYKARARSLTLGNAIRYLKLEIASIPVDMDDEEAKEYLSERIDYFIRDRIIVAGKVIQSHAINKIQDNDIILTFARSSVVESTLIEAKRQGKNFEVIVLDSRPLNEGSYLLNSLRSHNIPCTYGLLTSLGAILARYSVSLVMLGCHALLSDGAMFSRAGTASVANMCKHAGLPVACLCETYKFSDRVMLDSIAGNEIARKDTLASDGAATAGEPGNPHLAVFNLLYDVSRPEDVTVVISEAGLVPVKSVPAILRDYKPLSNQAQ